jgi:hypothetical protein
MSDIQNFAANTALESVKIELTDKYEVTFWCKYFNLTTEEIQQVIHHCHSNDFSVVKKHIIEKKLHP